MIYSPISSPIRSAVSGLFANRGGFVPSRLFAAGEQGAWYDPSDWSTLYQDSAGTTPVTAVEQPVGLMLDKSKGLVLGAELWVVGQAAASITNAGGTSGIYNASTGELSNSLAGTSSYPRFRFTVGMDTTKAHKVRVVLSGDTTKIISVLSNDNVAGLQVSPGVWEVVYNPALYNPAAFNVSLFGSGGVFSGVFISSVSVRELPGNHAYQTTSTSRPVLRQDAGGRYYLSFDGVDDFLVTNSIDFTSTDKMTVFAGVRKLSDAAPGILAELATSYSVGGFYLAAPENTSIRYSSISRGSAAASTSQLANIAPTGASPDTAVIAATHDIAGDLSTIRRNAVAGTPGTGDKGAGNFGNYPLYIGRRGGTTLPFNGYLYSLIVRGAQTSDTQVSQTETWVNGKTGAY